MRRFAVGALIALLVLGVAGAVAALRRPHPGSPVDVEIAAGSTTTAIGHRLEAERVIGSVLGFRLAAKVRGLDGRIKAGRYSLRRGMGVSGALDVLARGPSNAAARITIPEGWTLRQIAARVASRSRISTQAFTSVAASGAIRSRIEPPQTTSLEGFLFPDTYDVDDQQTARGVVRRMVVEFDEKTAGLDWSAAQARGLTAYQVLIVASMIEREAKVPEDRPKIAAVIYNRLARGMPLEIDATVLYDLPRHKVPAAADLKRPSPYNTYLHTGLPPTPIANPGLDSIRAALAPAPIDALYYVVIDAAGHHGFASTYEEFQSLRKLRPPQSAAP